MWLALFLSPGLHNIGQVMLPVWKFKEFRLSGWVNSVFVVTNIFQMWYSAYYLSYVSRLFIDLHMTYAYEECLGKNLSSQSRNGHLPLLLISHHCCDLLKHSTWNNSKSKDKFSWTKRYVQLVNNHVLRCDWGNEFWHTKLVKLVV